jgi:adenosylhomocysteine nucleosidase
VRAQRQHPAFVIAATGLGAEAWIAARLANVVTVAGGGDANSLERLIGEAIAQGGSAIISFGIAAGLVPGKDAGTCLIGNETVHRGVRYSADSTWASRLKAAIGEAELATIAGVDRPLRNPAEKRELQSATGAIAADMESHIVARLAAEHRLPFAILRVIADRAETEVPQAALAGMGNEGRLDVTGVLASLAQEPSQIPAIMRVAVDTGRAFAELFRCHRRLGPGFSFFDFG